MDRAILRMHARIDRIDRTADTGRWTLMPNGDWSGGYWNAMLWLSPHATDAER